MYIDFPRSSSEFQMYVIFLEVNKNTNFEYSFPLSLKRQEKNASENILCWSRRLQIIA